MLIRLFFAIAAGFLITTFNLDFVEGYLIDFRFRAKAFLGLSQPKNTPIVLVYISSKTVETYQNQPTFKDHIRFLNLVSSQNPKHIIYQFRTNGSDFVEISGSNAEKDEFVNFTKTLKNLGFATQDLPRKGFAEDIIVKPPLDSLQFYSMPFTVDSKSFGKDGISRRIRYRYQDQTMMTPIIASSYNPEIQNIGNIQGSFDYLETSQAYINYHPNGSFPTYAFEDVVNQRIAKNAFEEKIVIVGTDLGKDAEDYAATPYNRHFTAMTKTELQANQLQTFIDNNAPIKIPKVIDLIITILISVFTVYVTLSLTPAKGLLILAAMILGTAALSLFSFVAFNLWIDLAHPFLAIFLCYYFFIPYRLIRENRKSWEYYQKHKLLSEVEQLKTNFISMMSHDLKTPIARITGMTEVIYKDPQQLSSHQREALDTIRHSSDDLLKFINAILQYGSIESQGVQLHKQSKDINALVSDVIKKHQFLANVKKIKIIQELEPMFPSSVDPELMKQVFSNLLENAIKYSPDDSTVWIRSREDGDDIIVEFQDQGMGIPQEDLPNIFMKFFRTHNAKTTTIKGSGLGLYLAQYFVELHKGKITVESSDKGSKFTVTLPLDK